MIFTNTFPGCSRVKWRCNSVARLVDDDFDKMCVFFFSLACYSDNIKKVYKKWYN